MNSNAGSTASTNRISRLTKSIPGFAVLRHYSRADFGPDLLAGMVICLVLIPSALAYAELAGSGPIGGIYAALAAARVRHPLEISHIGKELTTLFADELEFDNVEDAVAAFVSRLNDKH